MRTLPTRRELVFVFSLLTAVFILFQFTSDAANTLDNDDSWSTKAISPWFRGETYDSKHRKGDSAQTITRRPPRTPSASDGARDSQFVFFGDQKLPVTEMSVHIPGWTVLKHLYLFNGTMFIVTDTPNKFPDRALLTSSGAPIFNEPAHVASRTPSDKDLQIVTRERAAKLFGPSAGWLEGTSFITTDPRQFVNHYYHWCAELFFGLWRTYSLLDPDISEDGRTVLPAPRRIMLPHVSYNDFRDYAGMTQWVTRAVFPAISLEYDIDWADRAKMNRSFLLDRVVLGDRAAAMRNPMFTLTQRSNAELFKLRGSPYWWSTVRNNLVEFAGGDPLENSQNVITYISRQTWGRRVLIPEDHDRLVTALKQLHKEHGYEVNIINMEDFSREEQIKLAARTTIMMGVHGNGLTSLLWMKPSKRATVMEFFYPGGFAHDYEWTTRALGMTHYGFWHKEYFTAPDLPDISYPEGFQGNAIPLDGVVVARLCHERLSLPDT